MQICSKCGTINEDKARFCENCGTKLEHVSGSRETSGTQTHSEDDTVKKQIQIKVPQINVEQLKSDGLKAGKTLRGISKSVKVVVVEAVLLVLLLCAFFALGNAKGDPGSVAKKYFKAYVDGDWSSVYRMTDFPVSGFLTEENYVNLMESAKTDDIINFKVKEKKKKKKEKSNLLESYTVEYTVKGEANYRSAELQLLRQNEKTMLFFPVWKVSSEGMVAEDFNIYVPEGAKVVLDHIPLMEDELLSERDQTRGWDHYQVTIFDGNHEIEVAAPWQEVQRQTFSTYHEKSYTAEDMRFTDEAMNAIEGTVKTAMEQMYQAAFDGKDYSAVAGLFDETYKQRNQAVYDELLSDIYGKEEYRLDQVTFNKFKRELSGRNDDGLGVILTAHLKYEYTSDYTHTYQTWTNQTRTEHKTDRGTDEITAGFMYDGTGYKLAWIDMDSVF